LLLENYDALAAALGSALKKFAPAHKIDIAASPCRRALKAAKTGLPTARRALWLFLRRQLADEGPGNFGAESFRGCRNA
jgi:hypothetical protein